VKRKGGFGIEAESIKEPVGDAVMELLGISLPLKEIRKGIPLVSFACRDGENDAVLVKALPLPEADAWLERAAAGEVLYRVDYLSKGKPSYETGILPDRDGGTFLERLEEAVKDRDTKAVLKGKLPTAQNKCSALKFLFLFLDLGVVIHNPWLQIPPLLFFCG
jgi:hypothetical protein